MSKEHQSRAVALIIKAADFAAFKHRNQRRKDVDASPYINHPIALAALLTNEAGITDPVVICAALLHDTIEDTETTPAELQERFGKTIAAVVMEVTDDQNLPKAERKRLQIVRAGGASRRARLVKLADKICNLRDIASNPPAQWNLRRRRKYFDWAGQSSTSCVARTAALSASSTRLTRCGRNGVQARLIDSS